MTRFLSTVFAVGLCTAWLCIPWVSAAPIDLLDALEAGLMRAEFRGAGDTGVTGTIVRQTPQPLQVVVAAGTVFRAQFGGIQNIATFESTPADLTTFHIAHVFVPGGCANFGMKAPTADHVMAATPVLNKKVLKLVQAIGPDEIDRQVAQVALWAVANDVPKWAAKRYVTNTMPPGTTRETIDSRAARLLVQAEALVKKAGLAPKEYRAFR